VLTPQLQSLCPACAYLLHVLYSFDALCCTVCVYLHRDAFNELTSQICGAVAVKAKEVASRVNTPLGMLHNFRLLWF
jgi:hypothetical protein